MTQPAPAVPPQLTNEQFARLAAYGVAQDVRAGDVVFRPGDPAYDLIVIVAGSIEIVAPGSQGESEAVVAIYGAGGFLGELNLLTGQTAYLMGRVVEAGQIFRLSHDQFRRLMADDAEISGVLLQTFLVRRDLLRESLAARTVEIVGSAMSGEALALRTYVARQRLPHLWLDADTPAGRAVMAATPLLAADLPAVVTQDLVLKRATPNQLARTLGLDYQGPSDRLIDLTIIGSGPAGLAAAVYGASEGLETVALDAVGLGGQAAASSRIENYFGFPSGVSGSDLTQRAALQAMKFGARLFSPCDVVGLDSVGGTLRVQLANGSAIETRAAVIATGVRYRGLPLAGWAAFEGAGIYYAATELEARTCAGQPVTVVGGANSAGQAALFLAANGMDVSLAVRGRDLAKEMSAYLVARIEANPQVTVLVATQVSSLTGYGNLESITLTDTSSGGTRQRACRGLFCFIGAEPATAWLHDVKLDEDGCILTGVDLRPEELDPIWAAIGRVPLPFESSVPGVFAAGDVRHGSMKRVAAAVGEGASVVRSVHTAIGVRT